MKTHPKIFVTLILVALTATLLFAAGAGTVVERAAYHFKNLLISDRFVKNPEATTLADNGSLDSDPAVYTVTTSSKSFIPITCNDTNGGCTVYFDESTLPTNGKEVTVCNVTGAARNVVAPDTSGIVESAGAVTLGQYDCATWEYVVDRYIELSASNN